MTDHISMIMSEADELALLRRSVVAIAAARDAALAEVERLTVQNGHERDHSAMLSEANSALHVERRAVEDYCALVRNELTRALAEVGTLRARVAELEGHLATLHEAVPVVREVASNSTAEQIAAYFDGMQASADACATGDKWPRVAAIAVRALDWRKEPSK